MSAEDRIERIMAWGPVLFGLGFIAPLISQSMQALDVEELLGIGSLGWGLGIGLSLGLIAKWRGSWL
jgi:hypothetical protein